MHESSEIDVALQKLHVNNEDEKEIKEWFKVMKENATRNIRHKQHYETNLEFLKDLGVTAEEVKDESLSEGYVKQLKDLLKDYKERVVFSDKPLRIALIGEIGVGKSTFGNVLLEGKGETTRFETSAASESCTQVLRERTGYWFGDTSLKEITVIDTPGLSDPNDGKCDAFKATLEGFKKTSYLTAIVVIVNGSNPRFDEGHKTMMEIFAEVFGEHLLHNMIIVGSRWPYDRVSMDTRKDNGESEETKASEIAKYFRRALKIDLEVPSFFLDSKHYQKSYDGWRETEHRLKNIQQTVSKMLPFLTVDIKKMTDKLEEQMELMRKTIEGLRKSGKAYQDKIDKLDQTIKESQRKLDRFEQQVNNLQSAVYAKDRKIESLQKELDSKSSCTIL